MPIIETLHNNQYIGLYEEYEYRIIGKLALYHSIMTNEDYDIVTNIKILNTNDNTVIYETNTDMAYNKDGYISIINYVEKVLFYLHNETCDNYWKRIFLDKLFQNMNTIKIDIYYKNKTREIKEEKERQEINQIRNKIDELKKDIQTKYNKESIAVFYTVCDLYIINESKLIEKQNNMYDYIENYIRKYPDVFKPYILNHIELNWNKSDIEILNNILN